jgi:hypothetical protein
MANAGDAFRTHVEGVERMRFEWQVTQRRAAARIIPIVLLELKRAAPVSRTKPDAGRFKHSIGFRVLSLAGIFSLNFVSTAPYAEYVIKPTTGGTVITPQSTLALRWPNGFGDYVFASSVVRGSTPGNAFNKRVALKMEPIIMDAFKSSITILTT